MLAAIGRRVQRALQKSSSPLLNRSSTLVNKSSNIWKYKQSRRSFSTSLFQKYVSEETLKLREELEKFIRQYPKEIDFKTANNGIEQLLKSAKNHEEEVECYTAKALMCLQSGDPQGAMDMSNKAIERLQTLSGYVLRAFALSVLGQTEESLKDLKTVSDRIPAQSNPQIWSMFAQLAQGIIGQDNRNKEYQSGALNVMKRAIQIFPNDEHVTKTFDTLANNVSMSEQERLECYLKAADFNPNNVLAWRYAINLDINNANQYVTQALLHNPSSHEIIWSTLTAVYIHRKDVTRAVEAAKEVLRAETFQQRTSLFGLIFALVKKIIATSELALIDDCQELLERILTIDPSNSSAISLFGATHLAKQQKEQAKECFVRALKLNDNDLNAVVGLAQLTTDVQEQIKLMERAVILNPRLYGVHKALAHYYYHQGHYERALEAMNSAIDGNPNVTPDHYVIKAMMHGRLQQYDKELQSYLNHFKMQMNDPVQACQVFLIEHRFEEGLVHIDTHLQKDPNSEALWLLRANFLRHLGRYNEALEATEKTLELIPNGHEYQVRALHQKGLILAHLKRTQEVEQIAKVLIDKYNFLLAAISLLGEVRFQQGKFEDAAKYFEKLLLEKQDLEIYRYEKYLQLARALEAKGDVTRAREMYALVHHINPFEPISAQRLKQLDGNKQ